MFVKHIAPAIIWALVILILCSTPGRAIPHISWLELLSFDKLVHAFIFFVLQVLMMRGFYLQHELVFFQKFFAPVALLLSVCYGAALEYMQYRVFSERSGDWFDVIANSFGAAMGLMLFNRLKQKIKFFQA